MAKYSTALAWKHQFFKEKSRPIQFCITHYYEKFCPLILPLEKLVALNKTLWHSMQKVGPEIKLTLSSTFSATALYPLDLSSFFSGLIRRATWKKTKKIAAIFRASQRTKVFLVPKNRVIFLINQRQRRPGSVSGSTSYAKWQWCQLSKKHALAVKLLF